MSKLCYYDYQPREAGMRALLLVQRIEDPKLAVGDYAQAISDEFGCSRATAYRLASMAIDLLEIERASHDKARARGLLRTIKRFHVEHRA